MLAPQRDRARFELKKECIPHVADALIVAAETLPYGPVRKRIVNQARRIQTCALTAYGRVISNPAEGTRFRYSNKRECRNRLCVGGEAERARELTTRIRGLVHQIEKMSPGARAIFLTLTTANRPIEQVGAMFRDHDAAVKRFFALARIKSSTLGHFTSYEVAVRGTDAAPEAGVHSHSLVFVAKDALSDKRYIPQAEYVRLWQQAARLSYKPVVDVRAVRGKNGATDHDAVIEAIPEIAKYVCKPQSYIVHRPDGSIYVNPRVVLALALGLHRRRINRYDRIFADAAKALKRARAAG